MYQLARRILLAALLVSLSIHAHAQSAQINGRVTDSSQSVISGAQVRVVAQDTGIERHVQTDKGGQYLVPFVKPGTYQIYVQAQGFSTAISQALPVAVGQTVLYNVELKVATQASQVTVNENDTQLEASTAQLGTVIGQKSVADLPLDGRNFTQLLMLAPGSSRANNTTNSAGGDATDIKTGSVPIYFPSVSGETNRSNYFMLDGMNDNENIYQNVTYIPIVDDIEEFKLQAHLDSAQYGGAAGGYVNVITKSGTNNLHGAAWEYNRNHFFSAANPFTHVVLPLNWNQYGFNIGGPVIIPRIYKGKNKPFFFGGYEGFRLLTSAAGNTTLVPTAAQLGANGTTLDFSGMGIPQLYDPHSTRPDPNNPGSYMRTPFPNNQIPLSRVDQNMLADMKMIWPAPNASISDTQNYIDYSPTISRQYNYNGRIDQTLGADNSLWFRYSYQHQPVQNSGGYPGSVHEETDDATNYAVNYLHQFNSTTALNVLFGHNVATGYWADYYTGASNQEILSKLSFNPGFVCASATKGLPADFQCVPPQLSLPGYILTEATLEWGIPNTSLYQWSADFSKVLGRHLIQAGGILLRNSDTFLDFVPTLGFASTATATPETIGSQNPGNTGNPLASALLGAVDHVQRTDHRSDDIGAKMAGGYVQDQWKLLPTLSLNFGLRYDVMLLPRSGKASLGTDEVGAIDFSNGTYILQRSVGDCATLGEAPCIPGGLPQPHIVVSSNGHLFDNDYNNWQPRLGFAYQVRPSSVVRGSFGMSYDEWAGVAESTNVGPDWPYTTAGQGDANNLSPLTGVPTATPENPLAGQGVSSLLPLSSPFITAPGGGRDPHAKVPYSEQFNLGIQQGLNATTTLQIDYVGSHFVHRSTGGNGLYNVALTPGPGDAATVAARQPFPYITPAEYERNIGGGSYNGLQVQLRQRPARGLNYTVAYTWSKTMDVACDGVTTYDFCSEPDPYHLQNDYSVAGNDLPQSLSISGGYELPIGKGRALNVDNSIVNALIGGWQLNGIYAATSGTPFSMSVSSDTANTGNTQYPRFVRVGDPHKFGAVAANPTCSAPALAAPQKMGFNPCAYVSPPPYTFGTEGRNSLRGGTFSDLDASVFKTFAIKEIGQLQFRTEAFNALNHISYGEPGTSINSPSSFGVISGGLSTERRLQFAVKFLF